MDDLVKVARRMRELGDKLASLEPEEVDVDAIATRLRTIADEWARVQMACAMNRADATAPEVEINGERWSKRRVHRHDYETEFGTVTLERSVYQQSERGRVACPWICASAWSKGPTHRAWRALRRARSRACRSRRPPICSSKSARRG